MSITGNDCLFDCPVIYMDVFHMAILQINISNNALYKTPNSLIRMPYLAIISINDFIVLVVNWLWGSYLRVHHLANLKQYNMFRFNQICISEVDRLWSWIDEH